MSIITEKYTLIKPLGSQSKRKFGSVFLVQNKLSLEYAILKTIAKKDNNLNLQERLLQEAKFSFNYEGLPITIDLIESEIEISVIKSYLKGIPLDEYWQSLKRNNRIQFFTIFLTKIGSLLNHLKANNIIHCDLKPSNILINDENGQIEVSIIDFGLALKTTDSNIRQTLFPLGYAAPELLLNHLDIIDHRTDQFSLGIIIWKLFTERLPLTHPNPSVFTNLQITYPLPDHDDLPKGYYAILLKMCNKHQFKTAPNLITKEERTDCLIAAMDNRFSTIEEFLLAFQAIPKRKKFLWF